MKAMITQMFKRPCGYIPPYHPPYFNHMTTEHIYYLWQQWASSFK